MRIKEKLQACLPISLFLVALFFILAFTGSGSLEFCGFGVDSIGNIYIGRLHQITVYKDGEIVRTVSVPVNRGWVMTVDSNDNILVANMNHIYTLDTNGTVLHKENDTHGEMFYSIRRVREASDGYGNVYTLHGVFGYTRIKKNQEIVYRIPLVDVVSKVSFVSGCVLFSIGLTSYILCKKKKI